MGPKAIQALDTLRRVLDLPSLALPAPTKDPLKASTAAAPDDLGQLATAEAPAVEEPMSRAAFGAVKPKGKAKTMEPTQHSSPGQAQRVGCLAWIMRGGLADVA